MRKWKLSPSTPPPIKGERKVPRIVKLKNKIPMKTAKELIKKLVALGAKVSEDIYSVETFEAVLLEEMKPVTINSKLYYELETDNGKYRFTTKKEFEVGDKITVEFWTQLKDYTKGGVLRKVSESTPFLSLK